MTPVTTNWSLYSDAQVPAWGLALVLVAAIVLEARWLRAETRARTWARALLPWTGAILLVLVVWLAWNPVLVVVTEWEQPRSTVICQDASASMETPLVNDRLTTQLDLLALWYPASVAARNHAARDLQHELDALARDGASFSQQLTQHKQAREQGLPPSEDASAAGQMVDWQKAVRNRLREGLGATQSVLGLETSRTLPATASARTALAGLAQALQSWAPIDAATSEQQLDKDLAQLTAVLEAGRQCRTPLMALQDELDAQFAVQHAAALEPRIEEVRRLTRREAAQRLLAHAPQHAEVVPTPAPSDETDLYAAVDQILAQREDETIANLVLISDGAHNGSGASEVGRKLRKAGIGFTAIGVGTPATGPGLAIIDWQAPRLVQSRRPLAVRCAVKAARGQKARFSLSLHAGSRRLAEKAFTTAGEETFRCEIAGEGLPGGRHVVALRLSPQDAAGRDQQVRFAVDSLTRMPKALLVGDLPDWDAAYFYLAAERAGLSVRQVYHGTRGDSPKRGASPGAIPKTAAQWASHRLVVLGGAPFQGFDAGDAETLFRYVAQEGGSLLIMVTGPDTCLRPLAERFRWSAEARPLDDCRLRVTPAARWLPVVKVGADGAESARLIASLGATTRAWQVDPQQVRLLENPSGAPLVTLGVYGRGKVYLWGLQGLYPLREYEHAAVVDRLLDQFVADAAAGLASPGDAPLAVYPPLPAVRCPGLLIGFDSPPANAMLMPGTPVPLAAGIANRVGSFVPPRADSLTIALGDHKMSLAVAANPGREEIFHEFAPAFLESLAAQCGGQYCDFPHAGPTLSNLKPKTLQYATATQYPLADHPALLVAIGAVAALHWVLRKLAGLAI